jgi:hypothetical protein
VKLSERIDKLDWSALVAEVNEYGCALTPQLLEARECREIAGLYDDVTRFRSTIDMARYRFGSGQYRYFSYPLPDPVRELRTAFYPHLLPIARDWAAKLRHEAPWPEHLEGWLSQCHAAGQLKPTPILLRYGAGDWNALHRDLYGDLVFPLQVVIGLDEPGTDHTGGEFLLVEQRPRAQSRGTVTTLRQGHALIFTTRDRPVRSTGAGQATRSVSVEGGGGRRAGWSASPVRHGVSTVNSGIRHTLGLVFHDAA